MDWKVAVALLAFLLFVGSLCLFNWAMTRSGPPGSVNKPKRLKRGPPPDFTP